MLLEQWPIENSLPTEKDKGLQQSGRLSGKEQNGDPRKRVLVCTHQDVPGTISAPTRLREPQKHS